MSYPPLFLADARAFQRYLDAIADLHFLAIWSDHLAQAREAVRDARRSARAIDLLLAAPPPRYRRFTQEAAA